MKLLPIKNCSGCTHVRGKWSSVIRDYDLFCSHPDIPPFKLPQPLGEGFPEQCPLEDYAEPDPQWSDNCMHIFKKKDD